MRFLLFSFARTGSTSLMEAFDCHPAMRWVSEPFNPSIAGETWRKGVHDVATLRAAVEAIGRRFDGMKHVWHPNGWPFEDAALNHELLAGGSERTLLLYRRNILKRVVSNQLGEQTRIWHARSGADRRRLARFAFKPLDRERIAAALASEPAAIETCRTILAGTGRPWRAIAYEDLFETTTAATVLDELVAFLGVDPLVGRHRTTALELFDPKNKLNREERYRDIPEILEIERMLGSDATGRLFG